MPLKIFFRLTVAMTLLQAIGGLAVDAAQSPTRLDSPLHVPQLHASGLRVERQSTPLGIQQAAPELSWLLLAINKADRNLSQTAYEIVVASSLARLDAGKSDVWGSSRILSSRSFGIAYAGPPLSSAHEYWWKVRVWDQAGRPSDWSEPASWTMGLLSVADWKAKWIAAQPDGATADVRMPIFRHAFEISKPIERAVVFVAGLGQYELHINGMQPAETQPAGGTAAARITPGWTNYRKTILYDTYDVTPLVKHGGNAIGIMLGNGMYNVVETKGRYTKFAGTYGVPKLILQLRITFADGTDQVVVSDGSWKQAPGPITFSSAYGGEDYDARLEQADWDRFRFDDSLQSTGGRWKPALEVSSPGGQLEAEMLPPVRAMQEFATVKVTEPRPGAIVYDFGQNFSGWPEIVVRGAAGATIKMTPGELLDSAGLVTQRSANAGPDDPVLFTYTLKGSGDEVWHPRFSYYGFRYVQVESSAPTAAGKPVLLGMKGEFLHASAEMVGTFASSNDLLNRIHKLIDTAILSNMVSVLTDCPHREKLGWLEQTYLNGPGIFYNYDAGALYAQTARNMGDSQLADGMVPSLAPEYVAFTDNAGKNTAFRDSPEWGSAVVLAPWTAFQFNGDRRPLAAHYADMQRYAEYLQTRMPEKGPGAGLISYGLGDWYDIGAGEPGESKLTEKGLTATGIYYQDLVALEGIAAVLGRDADGAKYRKRAAIVKAGFNDKLFRPASNTYDRGSQTALAMPLALGLVPAGHEAAVLENLVAEIRRHGNHVTAGDVGFHYVVEALGNGGRSDVLYDMLLRTDSPSYGYQLAQGATTLTEAWDTNPHSSQNHFMLGHAEEWFYRCLAGIRVDMSAPAGHQIVIAPAVLRNLESATASYVSEWGEIRSSWRQSGGKFQLNLLIPPGARATVVIPTNGKMPVTENGALPEGNSGKPVAMPGLVPRRGAKSGAYPNSIPVELGSGSYRFQASL